MTKGITKYKARTLLRRDVLGGDAAFRAFDIRHSAFVTGQPL